MNTQAIPTTWGNFSYNQGAYSTSIIVAFMIMMITHVISTCIRYDTFYFTSPTYTSLDCRVAGLTSESVKKIIIIHADMANNYSAVLTLILYTIMIVYFSEYLQYYYYQILVQVSTIILCTSYTHGAIYGNVSRS